jgi:hypothetical protein
MMENPVYRFGGTMRGVLGASVDRIMDSSVIGLLFTAVIV